MVNYTFIKATNSKDAFQNLYDIVTILRSENGCPYDKALSNKDSLQNLIDEAYEYLEGANNKDTSSTREEVGDILLNALMLLKIHEQSFFGNIQRHKQKQNHLKQFLFQNRLFHYQKSISLEQMLKRLLWLLKTRNTRIG